MEAKKIDILVVGMINPRYVELLDEHFSTYKLWLAKDKEAFLNEIGPRIRGLATSGNPLWGAKKDLLDRLPALEIIASAGVGYDTIDVGAAKERGIIVTNTPSVLNDCVADLGMALILDAARRIRQADAFLRAGQWKQGRFPMATKVGGKVCGIAGLGNIGMAVAKRAEAFGMEIHYYSRSPKDSLPYVRHESLKSLAEKSHFLVLTMPGGKETRHAVDSDILRALGAKGWLINISRGSVVSEDDLVQALREGVIAGAGLDVYENEPNVPEALLGMDNVTLLPHVASSTNETFAAMGNLAFENMRAYFDGKPVLTRVV